MSKFIKIILGLFVFVLIIIVAGGAILGALFDPNEYKKEIEQAAREHSGIDLKINGQIDWSVFPWLGLSVTDIDAGFSGKSQLTSLKKADISVSLQALLSGEIKAEGLLIDGLHATLVEDEKGQTNWQAPYDKTLNRQKAQPEDTQASVSPGQATQSAPVNLKLDIASIKLVNSSVTLIQKNQKQQIDLTDIKFETGRVIENQLIPVSLSLSLKQLQDTKPLVAAAIKLNTQLKFNLADQVFELQGFSTEIKPDGTELPELTLNTDAKLDLLANSLDLNKLGLNAANITAKGHLNISDLAMMKMSGKLSIDPFNLKQTLQALGQQSPETANTEALSQISFSTDINGDLAQLSLTNLLLTLDQTQFNGTVDYRLNGGRIAAKLAGDRINVSHYLPPASEASTQPASENSTGERYSKEEVIPVDVLKGLNLDIALTLNELTFDQHTANNLDIAVKADKGLIEADRINLEIYKGKVTNKVTVDARNLPVKIVSKKKVMGVQIADMLTSLTGDAPLTGTLNTQSDVTIRGQSVHSFVNTMTGSANVTLSNGVIKDINIAQDMCQSIVNFTSAGSTKPTPQVDKTTPFAKMGGNFVITNGVVSNNDLKLNLDAITANGRGSVNLPQALIDYRLGLIIQENLFKKTCPVNNKLEGIEWPVDCKGSFDTEPAKLCKPDASVIEDILKKAIKDKFKAKAEKKLEKKLKDKVGKDLLKGLFK